MSSSTTMRVYETQALVQKDAFTGSDSASVHVVTGSRMLVTLLVKSIDDNNQRIISMWSEQIKYSELSESISNALRMAPSKK